MCSWGSSPRGDPRPQVSDYRLESGPARNSGMHAEAAVSQAAHSAGAGVLGAPCWGPSLTRGEPCSASAFPLHPHPRPQYRWPFLPGALLLPGWGQAAPRDPAVQPWAHELAALHSFWKLWAARPVVRSQVWETVGGTYLPKWAPPGVAGVPVVRISATAHGPGWWSRGGRSAGSLRPGPSLFSEACRGVSACDE